MTRQREQSVKRNAKQHGAVLLTLLLIAVVAAAAVLLSAFSASGVVREREQRTHSLLAQASEALIGYAATHGRLPRPSQAADDDGRERPASCVTDADCTGTLPWQALGLPAHDSWGHLLHYSVTPAYTVAPLARTAAIASKRVLSRDANGAPFFVLGQEACTLAAQCAPAVIFSRGGSDTPGSPDEASNLSATADFMQRPRNTESNARGGAFDDLLVAVPLHTLYERMAAAKTLP